MIGTLCVVIHMLRVVESSGQLLAFWPVALWESRCIVCSTALSPLMCSHNKYILELISVGNACIKLKHFFAHSLHDATASKLLQSHIIIFDPDAPLDILLLTLLA